MAQLDLRFFDLEHFKEEMSRSSQIRWGMFQSELQKGIPLHQIPANDVLGRELNQVGNIRAYDQKGLMGHISVTCYDHPWIQEGFSEEVVLRLNNPLLFENGAKLPPCIIRMSKKRLGDQYSELFREDRRIYLGGIFKIKTDLSETIPSEWFER